MKSANLKDLENLSLYCNFGGILIIFLGIVICLMNVINGELRHIQSGIFIFISGYAFLKISSKISSVVQDERIDRSRNPY